MLTLFSKNSVLAIATALFSREFKYLYSPACAINLNFEVLLSAHDPTGRQLTFLNAVVNTDNDEIKEILIHPLVETFLYIKWSKLWKFYAVLLFFYFLHTIALTSYCAVIFIANYGNFMGRPILHFTVLCSLIPIIIAVRPVKH